MPSTTYEVGDSRSATSTERTDPCPLSIRAIPSETDRMSRSMIGRRAPMDLATAWAWAVERHPTRRAVGGPRPMTYAEWDARTARLAHALTDLGVRARRPGRPGADRRRARGVAAPRARSGSGRSRRPLSTGSAPTELAHCLADAAPALVVSEPATAEATATALADERIRPVTHLDLDELERRAADRSDAAPLATPSRGRPQRHALHLRHHRPAEGRAAHPPRRARRGRRAPRADRPALRRGDARRDAAVPHHGPAHAAGDRPGRAAPGCPRPGSTPPRPPS